MSVNGKEVFRILGEELVGLDYVKKLFRRGELTIMLWRKKKSLPYVRINGDSRPSIRFDPAELQDWAKKNKVRTFLVVEA